MKKILFLCTFAILFAFVSATIRNVPSTYATIQLALSACVTGDTVLVQTGTYFENITWPGVNSIVLLSAGDSSNTIIDGNAAGRVLTFSSAAIDTATVVHGFKITNGRLYASHSDGGGVYCSNSSPLILECNITGNRLDSTAQWCYGAGVMLSNSDAVFRNSSIRNNVTVSTSWAYGGGVHCTSNSIPVFDNCIIEGNYLTGNGWAYGAGIYMTQNSSAQLTNTIILGNHSNDASRCYGGGLYAESGSSPVLTNVRITENIMDGSAIWYYGGGVYFTGTNTNPVLMNVTVADNVRSNGSTISGSGMHAGNTAVVTITNSIFWNNNSGAEFDVSGATVNINYSCIRNGFTGTGNISSTPMFAAASDYHLQLTSPCINAGTLAGAPTFDLENNPRPQPALSNPDMGCYEIDQTITEVNATEKLFTISVYPNPVSDVCTIYNLQCTIERIEFYDAAGEQVFSQQLNAKSQKQISINVSSLASGIYICRIVWGSQSISRKIVKLDIASPSYGGQ